MKNDSSLNRLAPLVVLVTLSIISLVFVPSKMSSISSNNIDTADTAWMLTSTALVLLMTPGLSFFYGGMVDRKNVISTMMQSFISMGVISVLWVAFGFSLAFGDSIYGIVGNPLTYFFFDGVGVEAHSRIASSIPFALFALFQLKFAIITPALITGSFAERVRFKAYILFMCLFAIFIYAPLAHVTWHPDGILYKWGVLDFAGGTVVHISAGFAALAGAIVLGRRKVHQYEKELHPNSIPYVLLGTGMLWFGWFGFNAGSALGANSQAVQAFLNTNTASAAAMLAWIFFDSARGVKPSSLGGCIGAVVGLVAITPAAGFVTVPHSLFIGTTAAIISNYCVHWKSTRSNLDDTLDVFPCHGIGGIVGMVLTGVFATDEGLLYGETSLFIKHIVALIGVSIFTFGGSYLLYKLTNMIIPLRVSEEEEDLGLDVSQHGEKVPY